MNTTSNTRQTVVVAMSGGVDSSVAAGLLQRQGYDVVGVTMQIWQESATQTKGVGCCSLGAVEDARRVAAKLDIPHYVLNFREFFAEKVIENFVTSTSGPHPQPLRQLQPLRQVRRLARQSARSRRGMAGDRALCPCPVRRGRAPLDSAPRAGWGQGPDLCAVSLHAGGACPHPDAAWLGDEQGRDARRRRRSGLAVHDKPDSQEICFVQGGSYTDFLAQTAPETVQGGDIVDTVAGGVAGMTASRSTPSASGAA